jgi:GH24 family phage-related lysozyme (muramidase)
MDYRDRINSGPQRQSYHRQHDQALQLLERDLRLALQTVENDVPVPLTGGEKAALDDFVYNIGSGNFAHSTVLACLKAGDYDGACRHLADWNQQHGVVLVGLVKRRWSAPLEAFHHWCSFFGGGVECRGRFTSLRRL